MDEDLFGDGWREPGDDAQRMGTYIVFIIGLLAFAAGLILGPILIVTGHFPGEAPGATQIARGASVGLGVLVFLISLPGFGGTAYFLWKESKRWDLKHLSADRFIAGGFILGIGCFVVGAEMMQAGGSGDALASSMVFFVLGGAIVLIFLFLGLLFAYWPRVASRPRTLPGAYVMARYAVDDKLMEIPNHPCPRLDGWTPYVRLRTSKGAALELVAAESAYELAEPGSLGIATVRGKQLSNFHVQRRP